MPHHGLESLSRADLIRELEKLEAAGQPSKSTSTEGESQRLIHDLEVHQVELEMQNRELRDTQGLLEDSRNRYADLYDFAPVAYCTFDWNGCIREINLTGAFLLGVSRDQLIGKPLAAIQAVQGKEVLRSLVQNCFELGQGETGEVTLAVVGREAIEVQVESSPAFDSTGSVIGCRTTLTDISPLKRLEARLRFLAEVGEVMASPTDYRSTIAAIARVAVPFLANLCCVDLVDEDGSLRRVEVAFRDVKKQATLVDPLMKCGPRPEIPTPQARVIASGEPLLTSDFEGSNLLEEDRSAEREAAMRAVGPRSRMIVPLVARSRALGTLTFATAESGRHYSAADLAVAQDVARRAAMSIDNARLLALEQKSTRDREDLLAIVSHDLKNPLGVILMSAGILGRGPASPDDRRKQGQTELLRIKRMALRMDALIGDLLDAARISAGWISIEPAPTMAEPLITEALGDIEALAATKLLHLEKAVPAVLPEVLADRPRLQQVFANLLGNAVKFTPAGGTITIRAEPSGRAVRFSVSDTGPGIPAEELPHLFDRFWQAERRSRVGTGLGLFIVKEIVSAHAGEIWVESQAGSGTTFFFTLPVVASMQVGETMVLEAHPGRQDP